MALLDIKGLRRRFGGVMALDGADLAVEKGRITGLIGPNGAGKTTLFNAVTGALRPNGGTVTFDGTDVTGWRADRLANVGLSRTFQIARGLAQLSVIENLMLYGKHQPGETFCAAVLRSRAARAREEELRQRAIAVARELDLLHVGDTAVGRLAYVQYSAPEAIDRALARALARGRSRVLRSHGPLTSSETLRSARGYLANLRLRVLEARSNGRPVSEIRIEECLPAGPPAIDFEAFFHARNLASIEARGLYREAA